jgi:hypothetical protein
MAAVTAIAYAPLTQSWRHRMLTMQEMTCKIPLSAFYVEAYLLIVFAFDVTNDTQPITGVTFVGAGTVIVTGFIGKDIVCTTCDSSMYQQVWRFLHNCSGRLL